MPVKQLKSQDKKPDLNPKKCTYREMGTNICLPGAKAAEQERQKDVCDSVETEFGLARVQSPKKL